MGYLLAIIKWFTDLLKQPVEAPNQPLIAPTSPVSPKPNDEVPMNTQNEPINPYLTTILPWTSQKNNYHNVGVVADRVGLSPNQKLVLRGCVYQESRFWNILPDGNPVKNENKDTTGTVWSTDYGICQVNDYYQCGAGKTFPSVAYVLDNPEKVVEWMAGILKTTGQLRPWASFTSGAYLHWIKTGSPMFTLAS